MISTDQFGDLEQRVISTLLLLIVAGLCVWYGGVWFWLFVSFIGAVMAWETLYIHQGNGVVALFAAIIFGLSIFIWIFMPNIAFLGGILSILLSPFTTYKNRRWVFITLICIFLACLSLINLRIYSFHLTIFLIFCTIAADLGGYFAGRIFGGHKFCPTISPNKTWNGVIGGWVLAIIVALGFYFYNVISPLFIIVAIIVAMVAQAGDIYESWLKRRVGVKDSSQLIPGHGGMMDRFDGFTSASLLFGFVMYNFSIG